MAVAEQRRALTSAEWAAIGRRLDLEGRHAKLEMVIVALLGAEQIAEQWLGDPELRRRIGAAIAHAMDARIKVVQGLREERRREQWKQRDRLRQ